VTSLAHPGGNVTGFPNAEAGAAKRVELLKAIVPGMTRLAAMFNPDSLTFTVSAQRAFDEAARHYDIEPILTPVRSRADITGVIADLGTIPTNGLYVNGEPFLGNSEVVLTFEDSQMAKDVFHFVWGKAMDRPMPWLKDEKSKEASRPAEVTPSPRS
jgi:ABC-type uncharacterized transport system substrate-binding protein